MYGSISLVNLPRKEKGRPSLNLHTNLAATFYATFGVCVMCGFELVLCAIVSLCCVQFLVSVMCSC